MGASSADRDVGLGCFLFLGPAAVAVADLPVPPGVAHLAQTVRLCVRDEPPGHGPAGAGVGHGQVALAGAFERRTQLGERGARVRVLLTLVRRVPAAYGRGRVTGERLRERLGV